MEKFHFESCATNQDINNMITKTRKDTDFHKILKKELAIESFPDSGIVDECCFNAELKQETRFKTKQELDTYLNFCKEIILNDTSEKSKKDVSSYCQGNVSTSHSDKVPNIVLVKNNNVSGLEIDEHFPQEHELGKCDTCSAVFADISHVVVHQRLHDGLKSYKCDNCYAAYVKKLTPVSREDQLIGGKPLTRDHIAAVSVQKSNQKTCMKAYKCDICSAAFIRYSCLLSHRRHHTEIKHYICDICSASFSSRSALKLHERKHNGKRPYGCDKCSEAFSKNSQLKKHIKQHTSEESYKCDICSAVFAFYSNLICHQRQHMGQRSYVCDICFLSFAQKSHLTVHRRHHTIEKTYKCDICSASFHYRSSLTLHKETHPREKSYICDTCSAVFAQSSYLKRHQRLHT